MQVLAINGSPRPRGNTAMALGLMKEVLSGEGIDCTVVTLNAASIRGCIACGSCSSREGHWCVHSDDGVNDIIAQAREACGLIIASPVYYAGIAGHMKCFLDRLFYTSTPYFYHKGGAVAAVARRAGTVNTVDALNHYFALANMVTTPTQYWPEVYGQSPGEISEDAEGIQTIKRSALEMAWLLKTLEAGKKAGVPLPPKETRKWTNFVR